MDRRLFKFTLAAGLDEPLRQPAFGTGIANSPDVGAAQVAVKMLSDGIKNAGVDPRYKPQFAFRKDIALLVAGFFDRFCGPGTKPASVNKRPNKRSTES